MKRFFLVASIVLLTSFFMFGCNQNEVDLNSIDIDAVDHFDVVAGSYTIDYTIEELSDLVKNYGAEVSFIVLDKDDQEVIVTGNTFVVDENQTYSVTIILTVNNETKEKTVTIYAITTAVTISISFETNGGSGYENNQQIEPGSVPDLNEIPVREGFTFDGWYVDESLSERYMGIDIEVDTTLYAKWIVNETAVTIVSFNLNGGVGDFPDVFVGLGGVLSSPTNVPTKEGYIFEGWYDAPEDGTLFGFDSTIINAQIVLYAYWSVSSTNTVTVTYDLNGALQTSIIEEEVVFEGHPAGLEITPIYSGYNFVGWSLASDSMIPVSLDELVVTDEITLYAIWHLDLQVIDATSYFEDNSAYENSDLVDGVVSQKFNLMAYFNIGTLVDDLDISQERIEFGVLYSKNSLNISYYDLNSEKIIGDINNYSTESYDLVLFDLTTNALASKTEYSYVFYFLFEDIIVYSQTYFFETYIQVSTGTSVGCNYMLSGGYYAFDNGSDSFRPSFFIEILEGYTAIIDGVSYGSYDLLYREGVRTLITTDTLTGDKYLHLFHLDFQTPDVSLNYKSNVLEESNIKLIYDVILPHTGYISYPISEVGVIYSFDHPFLKIGLKDVEKIKGSYDSGFSTFEMNSFIFGHQDDFYVRAYAIINGKISYSDVISKFVWVGDEYVITNSYYVDLNQVSPEFGYSYTFGSTTYDLCTINADDLSCVNITNSIDITDEGQYFIRPLTQTTLMTLIDITIIDDYPNIIGITENGVYNKGVYIEFPMYDPYWYYEVDGSDYFYLPQSIILSEPGYYTVYYRTGYGMQEVHFQITE